MRADLSGTGRTALCVRRADPHSPGDVHAVCALLQLHLGTGPEAAQARYEWLYRRNPHGPALTLLAQEPNGAVVGVTSLFPRRVRVGGRVLTGAIGGDGFVRPAWRRRGVATRLHQAALANMAEAGIDFMFGPPEPYNLRALLRAGARVVGQVVRHSRILRLPPGPPRWLDALAARVLAPRPSDLEVVALGAEPDPRVDQVCAAALRDTPEAEEVLPLSDAAYVAWRFAAAPSGRQVPVLLLAAGQPVAVAALERAGAQVAILSLVCSPSLRPRALGALLWACADAERVTIQVHLPDPAWQRDLYRLAFLPRQSKPFQVQVRPGLPEAPLLLRPSAWRYLWGDGDVDAVL
ncbi:MAG: GNAT family N-acetyltransferase [Myxococcales bacterium]|nr:GNAT family N-acetyltransferase [Myxococcota bacterium]MDW8280189.1 GNAT family N-acetyltransferase [Myxococcales bacterium]